MVIDIAENAKIRRTKMTTLNDPVGKQFIEFFRTQGVKFINADTGEEIKFDEEESEEDRASVMDNADSSSDNDNHSS